MGTSVTPGVLLVAPFGLYKLITVPVACLRTDLETPSAVTNDLGNSVNSVVVGWMPEIRGK